MQTPKKYVRSIRYIVGDYIKKFNIKCAYCGKIYDKKRKVSIDHVVPKSKGGIIELKNIIFCCNICNNIKKRNLSLEEFIFINSKTTYFIKKYLNKIKKIEANGLNYYEELRWIEKYL